jgi:hypothetical protein
VATHFENWNSQVEPVDRGEQVIPDPDLAHQAVAAVDRRTEP